MDEQTISTEERLKQIESERKELRAQVKDERTLRLEKAAEMRVKRDNHIEIIQEKLKKVSEVIYAHNKMSKKEKIDYNILEMISKILNEIPEGNVDLAYPTTTKNPVVDSTN